MAKGNLSLNSAGFQAVPFEFNGRTATVHRYKADPYVAEFSEAGPNTLANLKNVLSIKIPNLTKGFGRERIDSDSARNPDEYRFFWDAQDVDTRWADGVRLGLLNVATTSEPDTSFIIAHAHYKGNFHTFWAEANAAGTTQDLKSRIIATTAFSDGANIETEDGVAAGIRGFDMKALGQHLFVLMNHENGAATSHFYFLSTNTAADGSSWTLNSTGAMGTSDALTDRAANTYPLDGGLIAPAMIAGRVIVANWQETAGGVIDITSFEGTPYTTSTADVEELSIASGGGPKGLEVYQDIDGKIKLWLGTQEGIHIIDASTTGSYTQDDFIPMPMGSDTCRRMKVHNGSLWAPVHADSTQAAPIWKITVQGDSRIIDTQAGLDQGDGVPTEMLGPIYWLESAGPQLFAIVGGTAASRNSRVIVNKNGAWHPFRLNTNANEKYLWLGYGLNDRIYYSVHAAGSDAVETVDDATAHPLNNTSIVRDENGFIDLPYYDGGILDGGTWHSVRVNAIDLSDTNSNEYVNVAYGGDDGSGGLNARSSTDLGDFLAGTALIKWASGAGVDSVNMGLRVNLIQDSGGTTDTPKVRDIEIRVKKRPANRQGFMFLVDIEETADLLETSTEEVITSLETARDLGTFPQFSYANMSSTFVDVIDIQWPDSIDAVGDEESETVPNTNARRTGFALVNIEEPA